MERAWLPMWRAEGWRAASRVALLSGSVWRNHHIRNVAERFAAEGYAAIAPELFHRTAPPGFEGSYTDFAAVMPHLQAGDDGGRRKRMFDRHTIGCDRARRQVRFRAVGFCLGTGFLYREQYCCAAAAVSFYGGGIAPALLDRAAKLQAPSLFIWGGMDKHITPESGGR